MICLLWLGAVVILYYVINWLTHLPKISSYGDRYVLITGCDTGFGNLLARRLDKLGFHVFAGCFSEKGESELKAACSDHVTTVRLDVTSEESVESAYEFVKSCLPENIGLWGLVNNAGVGTPYGPVEWLKREHYLQVFNVNLLGPMDMTRTFLPLIKQARGRVVNMSSCLGRLGVGGGTTYCVSKFGVEAFSDCIRRQLKPMGVRVSIIEPGAFRTAIMGERLVRDLKDLHSSLPDDMKEVWDDEYVETSLKKLLTTNEALLSDKLHYVIDAYEHALTARVPKSRYLCGLDAVLIVSILSNLPTWLADLLTPSNF